MFEYKTTPVMYQKCPVCEGVGTLPCNFYSRAQTSSSCSDVQCKTCLGRGIISMIDN